MIHLCIFILSLVYFYVFIIINDTIMYDAAYYKILKVNLTVKNLITKKLKTQHLMI